MNHSEPFCGEIWNSSQRFITEFLYGTVILVLETIGTPLSILTIIIFTRNPLSSSNILFTSLTISDLMVLILGIPQLVFRITHRHVHYQLDRGIYTDVEKYADHFLCTGQKIFYNISLYQTMILAVWRYIAITHPLKERVFCSVKITYFCIFLIYVICFSYFVPILLQVPPMTDANIETFADRQKMSYNLFYIIVLKMIPCIIVTICTIRFIRVLHKSKIPRKEIILYSNKDLEENKKQMNRTTKMVLGITIFFLTNNTGLTIGRILMLIFGSEFEKHCSPAIICINNLLVLIYTVIPFVVYYYTSQQFRDTFKSLLPFCVIPKDKNNKITVTDSSTINNATFTVSVIGKN